MATETSLNQIVKGASPPGTHVPDPAPLPPLAKASSETVDAIVQHNNGEQPPLPTYLQRSTPTIIQPASALAALSYADNLPSSPPQIYLNLLILESSLRQQYLTLLSRRRLNTFFLTILAIWNYSFTYFLFFRPREDNPEKRGGSPYWVVEAIIRLGFIAGILTAFLIWATGQYETGVRWPKKWLNVTNRGLRGFNLRAVIVKRGVYREFISYMKALAPFGGIADGSGDWHLVESPPTPSELELGKVSGTIIEEDLAASGDHLLLLLLPKNFSSEFRENWETYRSEYWDAENKRRHKLRQKVAVYKKNKAKELGGWKWWTGAWRIIPHASHRPHQKKPGDLEKHPHGHQHSHSQLHSKPNSRRNSMLLSEKDSLSKASRRRSLLRDSSTGGHSRGSSRSSTPAYMLDGTIEIQPSDSKKEKVRRGSSVSSTGSVRRSLRSGTGSMRRDREGMLSPLTQTSALTDEPDEIKPKKEKKRRSSRPTTPTASESPERGDYIKKEPVD